MIRKLLHPSLFRRLFYWQLLVILVAWGLNFGWFVWTKVYAPHSGTIDRDMGLLVNAIAGFTAQNPTAEHSKAVALEVKRLNESLSELPMRHGDFSWQIWRSTGELLSQDDLTNSFAPHPPGTLAPEQRYTSGDWMVVANYSQDGKVWVVVGQSKRFFQQLDDRVRMQAIYIPLIYALVLLLALWLATWRGLRPIAALTHRIASRQAGSTQPMPCPVDEPLELQPITLAINAYAEREAVLRSQEQRFFADAAHELRTPLAVIGAQAHVLSNERNPAQQATALAALQAGVQRAGDVLSNVLMLSRMDASSGATLSTEPIDLGELLRERVAEHTPRSLASNHNLGMVGGEAPQGESFVRGNRTMLISALDNLIDNALRYTPTGAQVDVDWGMAGEQVWLAVEDNGPGIPTADQGRIFSRFERGTQADTVPGSGLGLAIARSVAMVHGGTLTLDARQSGRQGCRFVMRLPRLERVAS